MALSIKELQIGDWVTFGDEPLKVQHIYNNGYDDVVAETMEEFLDEDGVICEEIKDVPLVNCSPIPLTPEILEKNGFYDRNTQGYYKRFGSYVCFDISISLVYREIEVSKICGAGTDCEEEEYGSSIAFGNDICVHTLQHALCLCGLNELADNFKV